MGATTALLVGCLALVVLSVWLPVALARRRVAARWRPFAASLGAALGLALTGWLAVLSFTSLAAS
jgi:hypothetical protein